MPNRVFTRSVGGNMAPGVAHGWMFDVPNNNRQFKLKSITWDLVMRWDAVLSGNIPLTMIQTIFYYLLIGNAANPIGQAFSRVGVPAGGVILDNQFIFYEPRKVNFDSFFIENILAFDLELQNFDLLRTVYYNSTIIAEVEDLT